MLVVSDAAVVAAVVARPIGALRPDGLYGTARLIRPKKTDQQVVPYFGPAAVDGV